MDTPPIRLSASERREADRAALALVARRIHRELFDGTDPPFAVRDGAFTFRNGRPDSMRSTGWTRAREVGGSEPRDRYLGVGDVIRHLRGNGWIAAPISPESGVVVIDIDNHVARTLRGRIIHVAERMDARVRDVARGAVEWARSLGHEPLIITSPGRGYHVWVRISGVSDPDVVRAVGTALRSFLEARGTPWPGDDPSDVGIGIDVFPGGKKMVRLPVGRGQHPVRDDLTLDTTCSSRTRRGIRRDVLACADRVLGFLLSGDRIRTSPSPAAGLLWVQPIRRQSFRDVVQSIECDGVGSGSLSERRASRCLAYASRAAGRTEAETRAHARSVAERTLTSERVERLVSDAARVFRALKPPALNRICRIAVPSRLVARLGFATEDCRDAAARVLCLLVGDPVPTDRIDELVPGRVPGSRRRAAAAARRALIGHGLIARTGYIPGARSSRWRLTPAGWAVVITAQDESPEVSRTRIDLVPRELWRRVVPHLFRLGVGHLTRTYSTSDTPPTPRPREGRVSVPQTSSRGPPSSLMVV